MTFTSCPCEDVQLKATCSKVPLFYERFGEMFALLSLWLSIGYEILGPFMESLVTIVNLNSRESGIDDPMKENVL